MSQKKSSKKFCPESRTGAGGAPGDIVRIDISGSLQS